MGEWMFVTGEEWYEEFLPWEEGYELPPGKPEDLDLEGKFTIGGWFEEVDGELKFSVVKEESDG